MYKRQAQEDSIPSLEVGKYVLDNVYVGLEQGMNGDASGVRVEIELAPNLNLEEMCIRDSLNTPSVGAAGGKGTLDVSATLRDEMCIRDRSSAGDGTPDAEKLKGRESVPVAGEVPMPSVFTLRTRAEDVYKRQSSA